MVVASFFSSSIMDIFVRNNDSSKNNTVTIVELHSANGSLISRWEVSETEKISRYGNGSVSFTDIRGAKVEVSGGTIVLLTLPPVTKTEKDKDIDELPAPSCSSPVYNSGYDQYTDNYYSVDKLPTHVSVTPYSKRGK